jgi:Tfp pilus assembly pilus retraction ATPase PilT
VEPVSGCSVNLAENWKTLSRSCFYFPTTLLFTGHTGCGKSTLLAELRDRLVLDYFVVMFSISDLVATSQKPLVKLF